MFGWLKKTASHVVARGSFDSTLKAVIASSLAVQQEIAEAVIPKIAGILSLEQPHAQREAMQFRLQIATAQRQMEAVSGASHEADPRWATAALLESWCTAALLDRALYDHVHGALAAWAERVPRPATQTASDLATGDAARETKQREDSAARDSESVERARLDGARETKEREETATRDRERAAQAATKEMFETRMKVNGRGGEYWSRMGGQITNEAGTCRKCAVEVAIVKVGHTHLCSACGAPI